MPHDIKLCYGSPLHCWSHDEDESWESCWRICLECNHTYQDAAELAREWLANYPEDPEGKYGPPALRPQEAPPVAEIFFCPLCMHDF